MAAVEDDHVAQGAEDVDGCTGLGTVDETMTFTRGFVDQGADGASPLLFPVSVMNAVAGQLALECKLRGVNTTVSNGRRV